MPRDRRGISVDRAYQQPVDITPEANKLTRLAKAQEDLTLYVVKVTGKWPCIVIFGVTIIIAASMLVIGFIYFKRCPGQSMIPQYLILGGAGTLFYQALSCKGTRGYNILILFSLIIWFFIGTYWIFSHDYTKQPKKCHPLLYRFAFFLTLAQYAMIALLLIFLCIICNINVDVER